VRVVLGCACACGCVCGMWGVGGVRRGRVFGALRLELRRRRVGSARGCEVEQARKVRRVDVVELLRLRDEGPGGRGRGQYIKRRY